MTGKRSTRHSSSETPPADPTSARTAGPDAARGAEAREGGADGVRSISRALSLLDLFDADNAVLTVADVAHRSALPKTTVVRILATLASAGMLEAHPGGSYTLGAGLLRWAHLAHQAWVVPVQPALDACAADLRETIQLQRLHGQQRVLVAQAPGTYALRFIGQVGDIYPLQRQGASAALLAGSNAEDLARAAASSHPRATNRAALDELQAAIDDLDRNGFAVSHGLREPGVTGVAVPVRVGERVMAALVAVGPSNRLEPRTVDIARRLTAASEDVASALARTGLMPA